MNKEEQLLALAKKRQQKVPEGFKGIEEYHGGRYECDYVSPYTKSAHNVDASVMLVLQDWSSDDSLSKPFDDDAFRLGHTPSLPTNKNLKSLLTKHFDLSLAETYGTNLFPFIKSGNISSRISTRTLTQAAKEFTIPQIEIIKPKLVICLGFSVFNAVRRGIDLSPVSRLDKAIANPFLFQTSKIWAQSHPGGLGRAGRNRGGVDRVSEDWAAMAKDADV